LIAAASQPRAHWRPAYVAIGSNLSDPLARVEEAFERLAQLADTQLEARSRVYHSRPLGPQDQPDFINAAAGLLTRRSARELLDALLAIERDMGRHRGERWGPRIIDLDLIWVVGAPSDEPGMQLPHPGVAQRNFVLYPLGDIAPTLYIPGRGRVSNLLHEAGTAGLSVAAPND
jgi:2-amino-4-hydroxy-6-hydroxymethyldihydropteridine diphosphokinase